MWRIWAIVFSLFLITKPVVPLVDYAVNYNYISKVLCENKAKPILECNGKCHLMKELAKASEPDKTPSEPSKKNLSLTELFCDVSVISPIHAQLQTESGQHLFSYSDSYRFSSSVVIFHPPAV